MVPDVYHVHSKLWELQNGWLSDRYRIATDNGCIVSNRICLLYQRWNPILHASLQVRHLLTGHIKQDDERAFTAVTRHARTPFDRPQYRRGLEGPEEEVDCNCNLIPASPWHQDGAVLGFGHQRQMPPHPLHLQAVMTTYSTVNCKLTSL